MRNRTGLIRAAVAGVLLCVVFASTAFAQDGRRARITDTRGRQFQGKVKILANGSYKLRSDSGISQSFRKDQVREIKWLEDAESAGASENKPGDEKEPTRAVVVRSWDVEAEPPLPINEESVAEMEEMAGPNAQRLPTQHFILIYTSAKPLATTLARRLEKTYQSVHTVMHRLGIEPVRPPHKLEIFFFADHPEYKAYGKKVGDIPDFALGFYMRTNNRSAFYDMNEEPEVVKLRERLEYSHPKVRRNIQNQIKRRMDRLNYSVIQHEAAHHIHFNVGLFPRKGHVPVWVTEGMAQLFETPPGKSGAGLGAVNQQRLWRFLQQYNRGRKKGDPRKMVPLNRFVSDDSVWNPKVHYPYGWAMNYYLWRKHRDGYAKYIRQMSQRPEDKRYTPAEQLKEFEEIFGPADRELQKDLLKFIFGLPRKYSEIR